MVQTGSGAGLIDKNGTTVLPCRYSRLDCLGDGLYYWKDAAGHAAGLAGTDGTSAFNDYVGDMPICSGGYISSYDRILNRAGTPVTPTFDFAGLVDENGFALVVVDKQMYRLTFADA